MANKQDKKDATCCSGGMWSLLGILFAALGFAFIVEGVIAQADFGFRYGFFAYLLGFVLVYAAKMCKHRIYCSTHKP